MQYALLIYRPADLPDDPDAGIPPGVAAVLERPDVTGWIRLHATGSATTVGRAEGSALITDGPFIDSKEYLAGIIVIEAADLDRALAAAEELEQLRPAITVEVRPTRGAFFRGA